MSSKIVTAVFCGLLYLPLTVSAAAPASPTDPAAISFFETKIRPLLVNNCYTCHSADTNAKGGLRVDDRNGLLMGGDKGPAIVAGDPEHSLLLKAVLQSGDLKMPPKKHLTDEQIADLTTWIKQGVAWPMIQYTIAKPSAAYEKLRKEHWAWQPLRETTAPAVKDAGWAWSDTDRYILSALEAKGLKPAGDADKVSLLRRVTFDLTGLPPTPAEIDAFVSDSSSDALAKVVDRLLASSSFGERWGRHWLDVARYAESTGSARNLPYPEAWRYRDYVIAAFNHDKPYDQFIREQIAGDLLPANSNDERNEHNIATGFLALGVKDVNQRFKVRYIMDNVDEQIDTVSRGVLALTVSCARCHDHKFDPIPTTDYYALAGIFQSTDLCAGLRNKMGGGGLQYFDKSMILTLAEDQSAEVKKTVVDRAKVEKLRGEFEQAKKEWFAIRGTKEGLTKDANGQNKQRPYRLKYERLQKELEEAEGGGNPKDIVLGVRDGKNPADTEIRIRGEAEKLGPVIPRGFLSIVSFPDEPAIKPQESGRLELAQWLTDPRNPLTPRVIVNRVWAHLFGEGLVKSVDNFGIKGDVPSNPALLDHLAAQFVREGWSTKKLVRELVLTHAYQLSADSVAANVEADPGNRLNWRHSPRRLEAEEIRDAMLAAGGKLNLSPEKASPAAGLEVRELPNNGPQAARLAEFAQQDLHRSVYLPLLRGLTPTSLATFDFAEQGMVTGQRDATTVAPQALYLLNDPLVRRSALNLAQRVLAEKSADNNARIELAYRLALGRSPSSAERQRDLQFIADQETAERVVLANQTNARGAIQAKAVIVARAETEDSAGGASLKTEDGNAADGGAKGKDNDKAKPPVNPDEVIHVDAPVKDDFVAPSDPKEAAWASFCQALLGSAEFRYLK